MTHRITRSSPPMVLAAALMVAAGAAPTMTARAASLPPVSESFRTVTTVLTATRVPSIAGPIVRIQFTTVTTLSTSRTWTNNAASGGRWAVVWTGNLLDNIKKDDLSTPTPAFCTATRGAECTSGTDATFHGSATVTRSHSIDIGGHDVPNLLDHLSHGLTFQTFWVPSYEGSPLPSDSSTPLSVTNCVKAALATSATRNCLP